MSMEDDKLIGTNIFASALIMCVAWVCVLVLIKSLLGVNWVLAFIAYDLFSGAANTRFVEARLRAEGRIR